MFRTVIRFLFFLTAICTIGCAKTSSNEDAVMDAVVEFHQAVSHSDYQKSLDSLVRASRLELENLAITIKSGIDDVEMEPWKKLIIARIQFNNPDISVNDISDANFCRSVFIYHGAYETDVRQWEVEIIDKLNARVYSVHAPSVDMRLMYENGSWKIDLMHTMQFVDSMIKSLAKTKQISEDEAIEYLTSGG